MSEPNLFQLPQMPSFQDLLLQMVVLCHFCDNEYKIQNICNRSLWQIVRYSQPQCDTHCGRIVGELYVPNTFSKHPSISYNYSLKRC